MEGNKIKKLEVLSRLLNFLGYDKIINYIIFLWDFYQHFQTLALSDQHQNGQSKCIMKLSLKIKN